MGPKKSRLRTCTPPPPPLLKPFSSEQFRNQERHLKYIICASGTLSFYCFLSLFRSDGAGSSKGSTKGKEKEEAPSDAESGEEGIKAKKTKAGKTKKVKKNVGKKGQKKAFAGGAALGNFLVYLFGMCDLVLLYRRNFSFLTSGAWI